MPKKNEQPAWTKLFSDTILKRGKDYFLHGKAKKIVPNDEGFQITVRGTRNYMVEIFLDQDGWYDDVICDCPYAEEGLMCKHMAAAFYLMDDTYADFSPMMDMFMKELRDMDMSWNAEDEDEDFSNSLTEEKESVRIVKKANHDIGRALPPVLQEFGRLQEKELKQYMADFEESGSFEEVEEYRYFQYEKFRNGLVISKKVLEKARDLLDESDFKVTVQLGFPNRIGEDELIGVATGQSRYDYYGTTIVFDRNHILDAKCGDWTCKRKAVPESRSYLGHSLCKHEAAVLLYLENYLKENNPGDFSNDMGLQLMESMSHSGLGLPADPYEEEERKTEAKELILEPILHIKENKRCTVSFKIGDRRLYVIKNLSEFMDHIRAEDVMKFGKKTEFRMRRAYIQRDSLPILDYIANAVEEGIQLRRNVDNDGLLPAIGGEVPLYGNNLDQFFELIRDRKEIECTKKTYSSYKQSKMTIRARELDYHPSLQIQPLHNEEEFQGISLSGTIPDFLYGQKYSYFIEEPYITRFPLETAKKLEPLIKIRRFGNNDFEAKIGRFHLTDFYRKMLPTIREAADVVEEDSELIRQYLAPEPVFYCYLDVDDGAMLCRVDALYGNKVHHLVEEIVHQSVIENYRDLEKEDQVLNLLSQYFSIIESNIMAFFNEPDEDNMFLFLSEGLPLLMDLAEVHMTDRFRRLGIRRNVHFSMGVSVESGILDLDVTAEDYTREELMEILRAYKRKARYVRLRNGDFLHVDTNESIAVLSELMESMKLTPKQFVSGKMHIPAYRALYLDKMIEKSQFIEADRNKAFRRLIREIDTANNADYDVPESLEKVLRNYQKEGYQWLRTLDHLNFGGILADEMGLGKTLQVITVLLAIKEENNQDSVCSLIVCPASLVYNWKEEINRFAPLLRAETVTGTKSMRRGLIDIYQDYDVLVTSYDLLKRDVDEYEGKQFRFMVIDEAQYIKNQTTAAAKSVKLIIAKTRFALTGTPIENRLSDMWSIFDYLMPGFLYDYTTFRREYETPIVKNGDTETSERLSRMAAPFILRRRKKDVLKDLPDKLEEIRYAAMERTQQKLYDAQVIKLRKSLKKQNDDEFRKNRIQVLAELTKLRQLCCDPSLYYEDYDGESAKRNLCMELVENIVEGEHKALIFSQFTSMLELLEKDLIKAGIPYYKITGATSKEKRMELVKAFNNNQIPVFLISLKAGGTGLNLTGADVVIHYDPWWNLAVQNQATDRAHRIGQTQIVTVYKLIIKGSIEEKIVEMQESKKKLAEDILNSENVGSTVISREDLIALLE